MQIHFYGAANVLPAERTEQASAPQDQSTATTAPQDTATLSSGVDAVSALTSQALQESAVRSSKIEALRQQVQTNAYTLDPAAIADAITKSSI